MLRAVVTAGVTAACGLAFAQTPAAEPALVATNSAAAQPEKRESALKGLKANKPAEPGRESVITAARVEFDNKEGVILFDENVLVDDAQFIMRSDRLLVFMEGTNDVQQIMAVGHVNITNANRAASCDKAVYTKKDGQIVMTGNARLMQQGAQGGQVTGERITIWVDDERIEVTQGPRVVLPPGTFNKVDKKLMP
jgi:lipopolysaccharide transport protein LptA